MDLTPVIVVGAGPVGLTAALLLASRDVPSVVLDAGMQKTAGSRAIALHRSALEVWEPLGITESILCEGISWQHRHTYYREHEIHTLDLPINGRLPWWTNLPQWRLEAMLIDAANQHPLIDLRWQYQVFSFLQDTRTVELIADTPNSTTHLVGPHYVVAADGAGSIMRSLLKVPFPGRSYPDRFLITDVRAEVGWVKEPRFYFNHPLHPGSTLLIHPQPDNIWRIDWKLGCDIAQHKQDLLWLLPALVGDYEPVWTSIYRFHQRLMPELRHGRVFFAGDAAHLCAPFGARGLNSGIQDAAALAARLAAVLRGDMAVGLLNSYSTQRMPSLIQDQEATTCTMQFMAPQTITDRLRQRIVLAMADRWEFARPWVNSGRMYIP